MIAKNLTVREKFTDKQDKPVFFEIKNDLSGMRLKDRLSVKSWRQIQAVRDATKKTLAKVRGKKYTADKPNFNNYLWQKERLLTDKAVKTGSDAKLRRAAALSELGATHLMGVHEEIKKGNYAVPTSCIIPAIALNNYIREGQRIPLTPERAKQAAKIAAEVARTYGNYSSYWARDQVPITIENLGRFLSLTAGAKGIDKEREIVRTILEKGSPVLDGLKGEEAYRALLTVGGDEGVEACRKLILEIRAPEIRAQAMEKCQQYWDMHWFECGFQPCALFPPEFHATLKQMEIMRN